MGPSRHSAESTADIGVADLKKMFSAHVHENLVLSRQRSDLDLARQKRLRQLNHNENLFLRKYEKYTPRSGRRRSIDASILRVAEANNASRPGSRLEDSFTTHKSLGRLSISNDCPYSMESWNMMVGVDKDFVKENKSIILFGDSPKQHNGVEIPEKTLNETSGATALLGSRDKLTNNLLVPSGRRGTLTPIEQKSGIVEEDTFEEEILCLQQRPKVVKQRRHSVNPVNLSASLPRLPRRRGSVDMSTIPQSRVDLLSYFQNRAKSDPDIVPENGETEREMKETKRRASKANHIEKGALRNKDLVPRKPVANAVVFVSDDSGKSERVHVNNDTDCTLCQDKPANNVDVDANNNKGDSDQADGYSDEKSEGFLPAITKTVSLTATADGKDVKSVTFNLEPMRQRSGSDVSQSSTVITRPSDKSDKQRRKSMTSASLQYMVDSHHGAAKLRYIALLSAEMEREAGLDSASSQEEDNTLEEVKKCRYLRTSVHPDRENEQGD